MEQYSLIHLTSLLDENSAYSNSFEWGKIGSISDSDSSNNLHQIQDHSQMKSLENQKTQTGDLIPISSLKKKADQPIQENFIQVVFKKSKNVDKERFKHIFKEVSNDHQRKNTNFTKFLVSCFTKHVKRMHRIGNFSHNHYQLLAKAKEIYQIDGSENIKIDALQILFGSSTFESIYEPFTIQNRNILKKYIRSKQFIQYLENSPTQFHNKKQKLLAAKIYSLRCISKNLVCRTQTK